MENRTGYIQVFTATVKRSDAEKIAEILSKKSLSACTQIVGPITSFYKWKGKTQKSKEWLCIIKTAGNRYNETEKAIKAAHPYKIPEIIALPIIIGNKEYLDWINKEINGKQ